MAETQDASIGWNGEIKVKFSGTTFTELMHVTGIKLPSYVREQIEITHLKSPGRRKQFVAGMYDEATVEVALNYRPGSDTDARLLAAVDDGLEKDVEIGVPINGVIVQKVAFKAVVTGYEPAEITSGLMTAKAMLSVRTQPVTTAVP